MRLLTALAVILGVLLLTTLVSVPNKVRRTGLTP
jgi:hypothetical protein